MLGNNSQQNQGYDPQQQQQAYEIDEIQNSPPPQAYYEENQVLGRSIAGNSRPFSPQNGQQQQPEQMSPSQMPQGHSPIPQIAAPYQMGSSQINSSGELMSPYGQVMPHNPDGQSGGSSSWGPLWAPPGSSTTLRYSVQSSTMDTPYHSRPTTPTGRGRATPQGLAAKGDWGTSMQPPSQLSLAGLLPGKNPEAGQSADWSGNYNILQLHERDDANIIKGFRRHIFKLTPFLILLSIITYISYLSYRVYCMVDAQKKAGTVYSQAWVFVAIECCVAIPSISHNIWTMWSFKKRNRPMLRLEGEEVPFVDVFITCCGEDDDVVLDTVRAACEQDYPRDRFRVVILDDAKSASLEAGAQALALTYPNLYYMARVKIPGQPHHFKAGNLNYGLEQMHHLPGGAAPFMAALDADMIPEPFWLRAILPHMLRDPKMALACPPQLFYNTPPADPLAQSLDFFVHVVEPVKDSLGVAWCTGSGYIVRREALDDIGNFPLGSLAEDVATSTMMLGKGWHTAFIHEPLQFGTVPEDFGSHLKQRTRWAIGTIQTSIKLNFCLWGAAVEKMTFAQRFSGFLYAALSFFTIIVSISLFAVPIVLIMQKPLVAYANNDQLLWLMRGAMATVLTNRICELTMFAPAGYHTGQRLSRYQLWMAPYIAMCIIRSFILPSWLGGQTQAFKPTGSLSSALNEREHDSRKNMFIRLWAILINYMAVFHLVFVYFTLVGVTTTTFRCFAIETTTKAELRCMITHAFWPPVTFLFTVNSMWTPISYAIDPPSMPPREHLLDRDPKTGVAHPTAESKKIAFAGQAAWFEFEYSLTTAFTILVFAASFWYF
ncbi:putative cellulose synthase 2 [Ceratocystis lukuohia]|uniref:Cellulose synthase 2 n=1 Tax=Ceratocystis lukuohia TaxID=2019550 RepID=A0ABR4MQD5_9PEZI